MKKEKKVKEVKTKDKKKSKFPKILILLLILAAVISAIFIFGKGKKVISPKFEDFTEITYGVYTGIPKEGDTFVPTLTLRKDNSFEFKIARNYKYDGQYHIAHNRVILTITEEKSYTFGKVGEKLVLVENVEKYLEPNTEFKLWGSLEEQTQTQEELSQGENAKK